MGEDGPPFPVVEIHNKADGDCLLLAFAFYLCVSDGAWTATVDDLRQQLLDDIEGRIMSPAFDAEVRGIRYSEAEETRWAEHAKEKGGDARAKYVFTRRRRRAAPAQRDSRN